MSNRPDPRYSEAARQVLILVTLLAVAMVLAIVLVLVASGQLEGTGAL